MDEATYAVRKALTLAAEELASHHPWVSEHDRWRELVFALLTRIVDMPQEDLRMATHLLDRLGLLEIPALSDATPGSGSPDSAITAKRILEVFEHSGFDPDEAVRSLTAIREAAIGLTQKFDGKIQRYVRSHAEQMLADIPRTFKFSALDEAGARDAFTYWYQNAMAMPLSLVDSSVRQFCSEHRITPVELVAAADELGVNLAFLDDAIHYYVIQAGVEQKQMLS